jgi:hypothetical protein
MWQTFEITVAGAAHRARFRLVGRQVVMEWRGGRTVDWCGVLRPEVVAAQRLRRMLNETAIAA